MLDVKQLRQDLGGVARALEKRGFVLDQASFLSLENQRKHLQQHVQTMQMERNRLSKSIGEKKIAAEVAALKDQVVAINGTLETAADELTSTLQQINAFLLTIPNILDDEVPYGLSEQDNVLVRVWGQQPSFSFTPKDHVEVGTTIRGFDFERSAQLSGARFCVMYGDLVRLHRALIQYMIDVHTAEHGYQEVYVPYLVHQDALFGTGQLPKFKEDLFQVAVDDSARSLYLIPTAEVPMTGLFYDRIVKQTELPVHLVSHSPCFRAEAGASGRDTRGLIRQHQFEKVELVSIVEPVHAQQEHQLLVSHVEAILQKLELHYRVMLLSSGDTGFSAAKTYDVEVWLPAQQCYREISSCSHFSTFQARRLRARYRTQNGAIDFVHTLNGSGLAVGRTLVAVLENYQNEDGSVTIPTILQPYMKGMTRLSAVR